MEIVDYALIPSTFTLAKLESLSYEEQRELTCKYPSFDFRADLEENNVEASIKEMIPKNTELVPEYPKDEPDKNRIGLRVHDFSESYDYSQSSYA